MSKKKGKVNILIVDDRQENLIALEAILESTDLDIIKAKSGNEALTLLLEYDFALILLDVQMPDMDGFEVAQLMKENEKTKYIPIIFLTAISKEKKYVFRGYETGAVDYLFKPIEIEILKSKVNVFLQLFRQRQQLNEKTRTLDQKVKELLETQKQLKKANQILSNLSTLDGLTGIPNRRRLDEFIETEWRRSFRTATPISVIMIDIDYFKHYNDNYGHLAGDDCLKQVAKALAETIKRPSDLVARYGGEEFLAVLPETDLGGALLVVEALSQAITGLAIPHGYSTVAPYITISQGLAVTVPSGKASPGQLLEAADKALYEAKSYGRNTSQYRELGPLKEKKLKSKNEK
ncbi:MAG: diguanylate cyclase [bacterium]|nr:diguanylate cyclase [bacterium]